MRVPKPQLSKQVAPICAEKLAMLLDDIALVNLTLPLRAYESRVGQDNAANGATELARHHSRGHAPHRMTEQNRSGEPQRFDEADDVAGVVAIHIPVKRCARLSVTPGVGHHHVVIALESARQRSPASSAPGQAVE